MLVHTVFFWLNDSAPAGARKQLADDCQTYLAKIPTVKSLWAGSPAGVPRREVVDASYDVGLTVVLEDMAGHDVYQEHPLHKEFLARNKQHWKRLQIYDCA